MGCPAHRSRLCETYGNPCAGKSLPPFILLVHIHINSVILVYGNIYQFFPYPLANAGGRKKEHLYLLFLYPHKALRSISVPDDNQVFYPLQCRFHLRSQSGYIFFRQEMMAGAHRNIPYISQPVYEPGIPFSAKFLYADLTHSHIFPQIYRFYRLMPKYSVFSQ